MGGQELAAEGTPPATSESGSWGCLAEPPSPTGSGSELCEAGDGQSHCWLLQWPAWQATWATTAGQPPFTTSSTQVPGNQGRETAESMKSAQTPRLCVAAGAWNRTLDTVHRPWGSAGDQRPVGTSAPSSWPAAFPDSTVQQADSTLHFPQSPDRSCMSPRWWRPQPEFPRPRHQQSWLSLRPSVSPSVGLLQNLGFQQV